MCIKRGLKHSFIYSNLIARKSLFSMYLLAIEFIVDFRKLII